MITSAVRLATTSLKGRLMRSGPELVSKTAFPTPFRRTLVRATLRAMGSLSKAKTSLTPILAKAMARIPDPVPTSRALMIRGHVRITSSRNSRQPRVVAWLPVPKAMPGSISITFRRNGRLGLSHGGEIKKPLATFCGVKNLRQESFQFLSFKTVQRSECLVSSG